MSRRNTKKPPRDSSLRTVIESLETRAMLAGVGPESWSASGLAPAPLGTGSLSSSGIILTCSSPAPGSSGAASPPAPAAGSGGTTSGGDLWDSFSVGSGAGGSKSGSTGGVSTDGPALSSQYNGGSGAGKGSGTSSGSGTTSGGDLWDSFSVGSGAGGSTSGSTGGLSTDGPALSSQYTGGSGAGGQGNGTGGTLTNAELWRLYWSGAGAGSSSSGSDEGSLADDPTISAQYTGGSGIGRITPLVYYPESDGPPVFHSGVWTGDDGSVQFVQTADTGNQGTGEGDALQSEGEPKPRTLWQWFWGDDPIKGSLWKLGPSDVIRPGDIETASSGRTQVERLEDGGKLAKEIIDGAKRDGALAGAGAVVGKLGAKNGVPNASTVKGFGNIGSHGPVSPATALAGAEKFLGAGYKEIAPGIFRSADGLRQFRMTPRDLLPTHGNIGPHVHFEALDKAGKVIENLHLPVLP